MDAVEFLYEKNRMMLNDSEAYRQIKNICSNEGLVEYVKKWSKENPIKTRLQDFKEKYPNAEVDEDGIPSSCAGELGYCSSSCPGSLLCSKCWNEPVE